MRGSHLLIFAGAACVILLLLLLLEEDSDSDVLSVNAKAESDAARRLLSAAFLREQRRLGAARARSEDEAVRRYDRDGELALKSSIDSDDSLALPPPPLSEGAWVGSYVIEARADACEAAPPEAQQLPPSSSEAEGDAASSSPGSSQGGQYNLDESAFARGHSGQVWFGSRRADGRRFVLKRLFPEAVASGLREIHFGARLLQEPRVARFVEAFTSDQDLWLVFEDEGKSLKSFLYETRAAGAAGAAVVERSGFWRTLRMDASGPWLRREIAKQLVEGLRSLEAQEIVHRDIKPGNVLISARHEDTPIKLGDFGSAVHAATAASMFADSGGPTRLEHTQEFEPPEVLSVPADQPLHLEAHLAKYDQFALGATLLEVLLGTDRIFGPAAEDGEPGGRAARRGKAFKRSALEPSTLGSSQSDLERARDLRDFGLHDVRAFNASVRARDPLKRGFFDNPDLGALELAFVFDLMRADPRARPSFAALMKHPYLTRAQSSFPYTYGAERGEAADHGEADEEAEAPRFRCEACGRRFGDWSSCRAHHKVRHPSHARNGSAACLRDWERDSSDGYRCAPETLVRDDVAESPRPGRSLLASSAAAAIGWCGSPGGRLYHEDRLGWRRLSGSVVVVVADGHQGVLAADLVTRSALMSANETNGTEVFARAQRAFVAAAAPEERSGAALTRVAWDKERLVAANVGDVRAYLCCDEKGSLVSLTYDHIASDPAEQARVRSFPGGFVAPASGPNARPRVQGLLALTRSLGDLHLTPYVSHEPYTTVVHPLNRSHHELLIVATDGLWDAVDERDALGIVRKTRAEARADWPDAAARRLVREARARGTSEDNVAVLIASLAEL